MHKGLTISVVIPCFNEEKGIEHVLKKMPKYVDEIIVVDNNSTDNTAKVAKKHGAKVVKQKIQGYGAAMRKGMVHATCDVIITVDGDGTYPAKKIKDVVEHMRYTGAEFVTTDRFNKKYNSTLPFLNFIGNKILTISTRVLYSVELNDSQSGMFCFHRKVLPKLNLTQNGMALSEEIKIEALLQKLTFRQYPIDFHSGKRIGKKKLRLWRDGFYNLYFLVKKRVS